MVCAIIVPWDCLLRNFSIYTFQVDALTQAFCYRLRETVVIGGLCSACKAVSMVLFSENTFTVRTGRLHGGSRLPTVWELSLMGFMWWLEFELHVCSTLTRLCFVYIYNALQHFNIFYRTKGNRRIIRTRQSMHFSHEHQKYSQAFCEGTYPPVSFMYWHSSSACSHFLSRNFKYLLMKTRNNYFDTLKDTILFKILIVELHSKELWIKLLVSC